MPRILWCVWTCGVKLNKYSSYLTSTHSKSAGHTDQITEGIISYSHAIPRCMQLWDPGSGQKCKLFQNARTVRIPHRKGPSRPADAHVRPLVIT